MELSVLHTYVSFKQSLCNVAINLVLHARTQLPQCCTIACVFTMVHGSMCLTWPQWHLRRLCAASTGVDVSELWQATLYFVEAAKDSVSVSRMASERQAQLASTVQALNVRVFSMACKLIQRYCEGAAGAYAAHKPPGRVMITHDQVCVLVFLHAP